MRGDFSTWNEEKSQNFRGTLHQQGRVLLDRDWNAQTEIFNDWQDSAARDIIGAGVAAVPSEAAYGFKITEAKIQSGKITVSVNEGRVWADGLPVALAKTVVREATYLPPPLQDSIAGLPENVRDAVILETWLEELNAFQQPGLLIEPALGGVDTTERIRTSFRFRLFRMGAEDTCDSIIGRLKDDFGDKGKLTATLQPDKAINGDCPVVEGGGYTGFEHQLYRIEIAETGKNQAYFKWSQFNGGLVGRGEFNDGKIAVTGNLNAVLHSGLTNFYLEILEEKDDYRQVTYGAKVTLDAGTGSLNLPAAPSADIFSGSAPGSGSVFFRLWNDVRPVTDFAVEAELQDGIFLKFGTTDAGKYTPHDFWTFPVRAGEISNNQTLINDKPPAGIFYHRVPLAELFWGGDATGAEIEDCRRIFQPLTKLKTCCTYRVGDGVSSHGDFTRIQDAIDALPKTGGEICILPGKFEENIELNWQHNKDIVIKGCGSRTQITGIRDDKSNKPVIRVTGGINLRFESFAVLAGGESVGILLEGAPIVARVVNEKVLRDVELENLQITAAARSAIELHNGQFVSIRGCKIFIEDVSAEFAAVLLEGDDLLFEENEIRVMSRDKNPWVKTDDPLLFSPARAATGGLHLSGGCERVRVINNLIMGGTGNGINLGNVDEITVDRRIVRRYDWWTIFNVSDKCSPNPVEVPPGKTPTGTILIAGAPLQDILIERNRILCMGRNGIGVDAFFAQRNFNQPDDEPSDIFDKAGLELLSVDNLFIIGNTINRCLNRKPVDIKSGMTESMGYGGIALSDVENLVIRDNFITDNGADYLSPTCGIYVLSGEGIEISRNQIINNGRLTAERATPQTVKNGRRGGVEIMFATQPTATDSAQLNGIPALTLRENVISVPMGRALTAFAMGDVSITGNRFLSQRVVPGAQDLASHILLFNLSVAMVLQFTPVRFETVVEAKNLSDNQIPSAAANQKADVSDNIALTAVAANFNAVFTRTLMRGTTLFAHNQCQLINQADGQFAAGSSCSIMIIGLDDVAFLGNQCNCTLVNNRLFCDTILSGNTVRAGDNFWQEIPGTVDLSAATFGQDLNTTANNQSTHCILVRGGLYVDKYNLASLDRLNSQLSCASRLRQFFPDSGRRID